MKPAMAKPAIAAFLILLGSGLAHADGVIEINQACIATGCFTGDSPGFPVEIEASGSYRLSSNLQVPSGADGIVGSAPSISLDLAGFKLEGPVSCTADIDSNSDLLTDVACTGSSGRTGITGVATIENGTVKGFSDGVEIGADNGGLALIRNVRIRENSQRGIDAGGRTLRLVDATVSTNGDTGVLGNGETGRLLITGSIIRENANAGVYLANGVLRDSLIILNGTGGGVRSFNFPEGSGGMIVDSQFIRNQSAIIGRDETGVRNSLFVENDEDISGATSISGNLCDGASC